MPAHRRFAGAKAQPPHPCFRMRGQIVISRSNACRPACSRAGSGSGSSSRSWHMPFEKRNGSEEFNKMHIKNAYFFDIDKISDPKTNLPHMLPSKRKFEEKIRKFIPPRAAPSHANIIMGTLDKIQSANDTQIRPTLDYMAERIKKRGLVILISDLLDDPDQVLMGLNHFRHNKQEMIVFHLLDRQELEFQFGNRTKFRDLETDETITTEPWHIRSAYRSAAGGSSR